MKNMKKTSKTIVLNLNLSEVARLVDIIEEFCKAHHLTRKAAHNLKLILEEIVVNIISYGYEDQNEHEIEVHFQKEGDRLSLSVKDDAKAFNPLDAPPPELDKPFDDREPGGLGIYLVRNYTKNIEYRREGNLNILEMEMDV